MPKAQLPPIGVALGKGATATHGQFLPMALFHHHFKMIF